MNKAYIILAHKDAQQLYRLIETLTDDSSYFFVHIDKTVSFSQFQKLHEYGERVHVVERADSRWGSIGAAEAAINGLRAVQKRGLNIDRIILLSGQDYPIKSNAYINNFFKTSPHSVFLHYWPLPDYNRWPNEKGGMYRVNKYYFGLKKYQLFISRSLNLVATYLPFLRRKIPDNMKPFAGSQWWSVDRYASDYILNYVDNHPQYYTFHRCTFVCDELFFQMILLNSKDERILKSIQNDNKRFMKWKTGAGHPEMLGITDVEEIMKSDALFARKFDIKNSEVLDMIDAKINSGSQ